MDGWVETGINVRGDSTNNKGVNSRTPERFFHIHRGSLSGWVIIVRPRRDNYERTYITALGDCNVEVRDWIIEVPCFCLGSNSYLEKEMPIPVSVNSITIGCKTCNIELAKVTGLITQEWRILVPEELYKTAM